MATVVARTIKACSVLCLIALTAPAHTWTFNQDGSIETQAGTWTFKKGGRLDAEFERMKGTNLVVLRRTDGSLCDVPLAVLSEKDQDFVLHPPEDGRLEGPAKIVSEAAKIERYWRSHALNVVDEIEDSDYPASAGAQAACNEIIAAMKSLTNILDSSISYESFSHLLQSNAVAVEKIKERSGTGLPRSFLHHTDEFFRFMMNSRDDWSDEVKGERPEYKEYCAFLRRRGWALARVHFLYCAGIAEKSPGTFAAIVEAETAIVQSEQQIARKKPASSPYPVLHAMTPAEINDRLRVERAAVLTGAN